MGAFLALWYATYPSWADPKNPQYVAWKLGICPMNLDHVMETMVGDGVPNRNSLANGRTENELVEKFGYVTTLEQASAYYQSCYNNSYLKGQQVLFLRNSNWMVVMKNGRASKLVLVKGC